MIQDYTWRTEAFWPREEAHFKFGDWVGRTVWLPRPCQRGSTHRCLSVSYNI